jgi:YebC/PmpR family DNA-binding regulatory protein
MSGHSKWSTIKRKKGKADEQRGRIFTKLIREITIAAREGGGDAETNPRLRTAVQTAKGNNMPAANIDRAIKKGTGELPGTVYEEVVYEGYGPAGVAFLIDVVTDNRNRTTAEIRHLLTKAGGRMGEVGSVAWIFDKKGLIVVDKGSLQEDEVMMTALEAGADDVSDEGDSWEIVTPFADVGTVADALRENGIEPASADVARLPKSTVELDLDTAKQTLRLADSLEENDDVQRVSANFDIPEEILETLSND